MPRTWALVALISSAFAVVCFALPRLMGRDTRLGQGVATTIGVSLLLLASLFIVGAIVVVLVLL